MCTRERQESGSEREQGEQPVTESVGKRKEERKNGREKERERLSGNDLACWEDGGAAHD